PCAPFGRWDRPLRFIPARPIASGYDSRSQGPRVIPRRAAWGPRCRRLRLCYSPAMPSGREDDEILTWDEFGAGARALAQLVLEDGFAPTIVLAIARGG